MAPSCNTGEAVLQAWVSLKPQGFSVKEETIAERLGVVEEHLLGCVPRVQKSDELHAIGRQQLFATSEASEKPFFLTMLRPRSGLVDFLDFWTACSNVVHCFTPNSREGLLFELETLRDDILRLMQSGQVGVTPRDHPKDSAALGISSSVLLDNLHRITATSTRPAFWRTVLVALDAFKNVSWFTIHQLTNVFMSWLYQASLWERNQNSILASSEHAKEGPMCAPLPLEVLRSACSVPNANLAIARMRAAAAARKAVPVYLHIYDLSQDDGVQWLNKLLAYKHSPVKLGGAFHAGVEVNELEWCFGSEYSSTKYGLWCSKPKQHPKHHYRQTICQGYTTLSKAEIVDVVEKLLEEYPGEDYNVLTRNCCHFADDFCHRLGVAGVPSWVQRFGEIGANLESMLPTSLIDQLYELVDPLAKPLKMASHASYGDIAINGPQWDPLRNSILDTSSSDEC